MEFPGLDPATLHRHKLLALLNAIHYELKHRIARHVEINFQGRLESDSQFCAFFYHLQAGFVERR